MLHQSSQQVKIALWEIPPNSRLRRRHSIKRSFTFPRSSSHASLASPFLFRRFESDFVRYNWTMQSGSW